jgi:transcriptional regulator with XRE-family HTH domain
MIGDYMSELLPVSFGDLLRSLRTAAGLTQEDLAEAAGVSYRSVSDLERGVSRFPRRDTARLLADALGLFGDDRARFEAAARGRPPTAAGNAAPWPLPGGIAAATRTLPMTALSPERRKDNLPAEVTRFIGRRRELSLIMDALGRYRLVTLCGTGGVGKTRLALRMAADVRRSFADGVWVAELSALWNAQLLARTVAASLGLPDQAAGDPASLLADYLRDRHVLLVLDTCEHLVDACARLAEMLLRTAPQLRILATSREPLNVMGEQALLISPLEIPDPDTPDVGCESVALFIDRAEAIVPGFTLSTADQQAVFQICRGWTGFPLPWSWRRYGCVRCRWSRSLPSSLTGSSSSARLVPAWIVIRRCARRSAGVMTCAPPPNSGCGHGCRFSLAASTWMRPSVSAPGTFSAPAPFSAP